jgi:hypothetical protein
MLRDAGFLTVSRLRRVDAATLCRPRLGSVLVKVGFVVNDVKLEEIVLVMCSLLVCPL